MINISHKASTLRIATASAKLKIKQASLKIIQDNTGPKPDILPTARAAGFLAAKSTFQSLPHCHPIPVEACNIDFEFGENELKIIVEITTIYKTGCEIEALHAASITALTVYDMLKPIDKEIEIHSIKLEHKRGGKTTFRDSFERNIRAAVIVSSDSVSTGKKEDRAGKAIIQKLAKLPVEVEQYIILPDEPEQLAAKVSALCDAGVELILTTGGTGLGPRDQTPEALQKLIEREIPGMMEAARNYGQERTPYAMLSRGIAGLRGRSLIITLPGSTKGAEETMDALFPATLHIFKVLDKGYKH